MRIRFIRLLAVSLCLCLFATTATAQPDPQRALRRIDSFIEKVMEDWHVPGLAVTVVKDSVVVLSRGYGLRDVEGELEVTPRTLFAIGSSSKAFTTMAIGMLVDDGKLDWDEPVRSYLPAFQMWDAFATERMTPRDLVTHRSGLPRHDAVWYNSPLSRKDIFDRLQYLEPSQDFRTTFQYQNIMFMTAGYLVGQMSGGTWEDFVRSRIFDPLGMDGSNFSVSVMARAADAAKGYRWDGDEEKLVHMPYRNIDAIGPAGSINSNVEDMANWLKLHLGRGTVEGEEIVSRGQVNQMHTPYMFISSPASTPELPTNGYGLAWFIQPYRGHFRVQHGGNIDGFSALVSLLPLDGIGIVLLTNLNGNPANTFVERGIVDRLLGLDPIDWSGKALEARRKAAERAEAEPEEEEEEDRVEGTQPSHTLEAYTGTFEHPGYGVATIELEEGALKLTYNNMSTILEHWHYDVFRSTDDEVFENVKIVFHTNLRGDLEEVHVPIQTGVADIVFARVASESMKDPEFLRRFVGAYTTDSGQTTMTISLEGATLKMNVPGQPTYELVPYEGTEFTVKNLTGYSVEFVVEDGKVTAIKSKQPNGTFTLKRVEK
jgi:CubicO group peptidase (beta-lactamase class C family)